MLPTFLTEHQYISISLKSLWCMVYITIQQLLINHLPPACWSTFWKSTFKQQLGCRFDIMDNISSFFCILTFAIIYVSLHHIIFRLYLYFLNIVLYFFKYSCTSIFHRHSLYTFYWPFLYSLSCLLNAPNAIEYEYSITVWYSQIMTL